MLTQGLNVNHTAYVSSVPIDLDGTKIQFFPAPNMRLSQVLCKELGIRDVKTGNNAGYCGHVSCWLMVRRCVRV